MSASRRFKVQVPERVSSSRLGGRLMDYARAAALAVGARLLQWAVRPYIQQSPFLLVTAAVLLAGWRGGWGPALVAITIGAIGVDLLFLPPTGVLSLTARDFGTVALFVLVGLIITWLNVSRQHALRAANEQQQWLQTTLRSIADAVIATDRKGRVQVLNSVAETFTGWSTQEAMGRPLDEVFHVVDEKTGERVVSPVDRVIREGRAIGLSNHTALISRSGLKYVIEEAGAPIRGYHAMSALYKTECHVGAHPPESDHCELHRRFSFSFSSPPVGAPEAPVHGGVCVHLCGDHLLLRDLLLLLQRAIALVSGLVAHVEAVASLRVGVHVEQLTVASGIR